MLTKINNFIVFGKITKTHGLKGELRLLPFFAETDFFLTLREVILCKDQQILGCYPLISARDHGKYILIKLANIETIDAAETLITCDLALKPEDVPTPKDDEFYIEDLVGLKVVNTAGTHLGEVKNILQTPSNDVYEILTLSGEELLVPGVKDYVTHIDFPNKTLTIIEPKYL